MYNTHKLNNDRTKHCAVHNPEITDVEDTLCECVVRYIVMMMWSLMPFDV